MVRSVKALKDEGPCKIIILHGLAHGVNIAWDKHISPLWHRGSVENARDKKIRRRSQNRITPHSLEGSMEWLRDKPNENPQ
ncbi:hypothetical protein SUGI_0811760 [Cryptomeria japonica]|nr:hypothetical protein SUGI_0811760 [Cryptomeria japonica]